MNQPEQGALGKVQLCDKCTQKILSKVERFGYSTQYDAIKNEGYTDDKAILRALKKNKRDILQAVDYLKNAPPKKERKPKFGREDKIERGPKKCNKKCTELTSEGEDKFNADKQERKNERIQQRKAQKYQKMVEEIPQFEAFNETMKLSGFEDAKKNFKSLKKFQGDIQKASDHLRHKKILETIELRKSFSKGEFNKVYLDCNNCFYLEPSFMKKAIKGNYREIEEKIATLMKIFQSMYGSHIEIVLVFDNSKLMKDEQVVSNLADNTFKLVTAQPKFQIADDAIVQLASTESIHNQQRILYITSDRMLQARLIDNNAKNIIASKTFFNIIKEEIVGRKSYSAIVDA